MNQSTNVTIREEAIADELGETNFNVGPSDHSGVSSLRYLEDSSVTIKVRKSRLDTIIPANIRVRLIKIDVEGAELLALRGMKDILKRDRPYIILEVTDAYLKGLGSSSLDLHLFLQSFGYMGYLIDHNGLVPLQFESGKLPDQFNALYTIQSEIPVLARS